MSQTTNTQAADLDNTDKLKRALATVVDHMDRSQDFRKTHEEIWSRIYAEYMNHRGHQQSKLTRANLKSAQAFVTIETSTPQMVEAFLERPYLQVQGRYPDDQADAAFLTEHFSYQIDEIPNFQTAFTTFVKDCRLYGTSVAKCVWRRETKPVQKRLSKPDELGVLTRSREPDREVVFDGPDFEAIDLKDFFPDPGASKPAAIQVQRGVVHRVFRRFDQLKSNERRPNADGSYSGIYTNLSELELGTKNNGFNAWVNKSCAPTQDTFSRNKDIYNKRTSGSQNENKIELWEYWGLFEVSPGVYEEYVITVANGNVVIRCDKNPLDYQFRPFLAAVCYPLTGEFYGIGEIEHALSNIKEGTALRNLRLDAMNQAVNRMWKVDRNAGINIRNLYSRANGIILTDDMNGLEPIPPPDIPASIERQIAQLDFEYQNITANINASQSTQNLGRAFTRTATGVQYLKSFTEGRVILQIRLLNELFWKELGKMFLCYNRQFMDEENYRRIHGDVPNPMVYRQMDSFYKQYDFTIDSLDRLNREGRINFWVNGGSNIVGALEALSNSKYIKGDVAIQQFFKDLQWPNVSNMLRTPEEVQKLEQQQMQQQMMLQQQQADMQAESKMKQDAAKGEVNKSLEDHKTANEAGMKMMEGLLNAGGTEQQPE